MSAIWQDFKEFFYGLFQDFMEFQRDLFLVVFEKLLDGFVYVIDQIPVPDFLMTGFQDVINTFPPTVLYLMNETGVITGLGILSAGFAFRLVRKFATLFQW